MKTILDRAIEIYGELPVPPYLGEVEPTNCAECDTPGATSSYLAGELEGRKVTFVACDNVCAGILFFELLECAAGLSL